MIEYRKLDYSKDIEEVVSLIKRNLNSDYSEDILRWKHLESPFGQSVGLIAIEKNKFVGLVFASEYIFQNFQNKQIRSIRFFDACTEPNQRGKGIFKNLMGMAFDIFQGRIDFSFSNPNKASLKGHLRVGYQEPQEKVYYRLGLVQPKFGEVKGFLKSFEPINLNDKPLTTDDFYLAGNSTAFLNWRYREKRYKISQYKAYEGGSLSYIIHRIEWKKGLKVIVLCDYFGDGKNLPYALDKVCRKEKTYLIYYLENRINKKLKLLISGKNKKAVIVFKRIMGELPNKMVITLGDLEGRL